VYLGRIVIFSVVREHTGSLKAPPAIRCSDSPDPERARKLLQGVELVACFASEM
jgi:hypothetical protein